MEFLGDRLSAGAAERTVANIQTGSTDQKAQGHSVMDQGGSTACSSPTLVDGEHSDMDQGCSTASSPPTLVDGEHSGLYQDCSAASSSPTLVDRYKQ